MTSDSTTGLDAALSRFVPAEYAYLNPDLSLGEGAIASDDPVALRAHFQDTGFSARLPFALLDLPAAFDALVYYSLARDEVLESDLVVKDDAAARSALPPVRLATAHFMHDVTRTLMAATTQAATTASTTDDGDGDGDAVAPPPPSYADIRGAMAAGYGAIAVRALTFNPELYRVLYPDARGMHTTGDALAHFLDVDGYRHETVADPRPRIGSVDQIPVLDSRGTLVLDGDLHVKGGIRMMCPTAPHADDAATTTLQDAGAGGDDLFRDASDPECPLHVQNGAPLASGAAGALCLNATTGGRVGVGTAAPAYALDVEGEAHASRGVVVSSDNRIKCIVKRSIAGSPVIASLMGRLDVAVYTRVAHADDALELGVVAQDVAEAVEATTRQFRDRPDLAHDLEAINRLVRRGPRTLARRDLGAAPLHARVERAAGDDHVTLVITDAGSDGRHHASRVRLFNTPGTVVVASQQQYGDDDNDDADYDDDDESIAPCWSFTVAEEDGPVESSQRTTTRLRCAPPTAKKTPSRPRRRQRDALCDVTHAATDIKVDIRSVHIPDFMYVDTTALSMLSLSLISDLCERRHVQ